MQSSASTVDGYIAELPVERREPITKLRKILRKHLPKGFKEEMSYGMIGYVVPHKLYPEGYHCDPKLPLPFMSLASQKNFIAVYTYVFAFPELLKWFTSEYAKRVEGKLDMGKSCIRFKKPEKIPYDLIGELAEKISVEDWIKKYESEIKE